MAPGENPAPFVVPANLTGNRAGAIRMWQTRLSFAVGFLLSAGGSIAVAETAIQAGQGRQPLSLAEFATLVDDNAVVVTAPVAPTVVPDPAQRVQTTQDPSQEPIDHPSVPPTAERKVLTFSLVDFVEKASAEGTGEVPRVSLVDLVSKASEPEAVKPVPASAQSVEGESPTKAPEVTPVVEQQQAATGEVVSVATPPTKTPEVTPIAEQQQIATDEARASEPATVSVPPVSPALSSALLSTTPPSQGSLSFKPFDLADFDASSSKLQLFDAVHSALNEHPAIVESLSRLDAQQEQISVARAGYWPQLRGGVNTGYRHTTGRSEEAFTLSASQMLYDFGKVSSAVDAAARGVDREEASVLLAAEDLVRETAQAFIEARRYEVLLELATEQIAAIAELEELAAKRSALGASSVSDQVQAKSRGEAARAVQLQMQAQRDQWHSALEKLIGSTQRLTLDEAYPEPLVGLCPRLPENFDSAPQVIIAEAERAEAEAGIRQARAELRPTLSLNADFEHYLDRDTGTAQQLDDQEFVVSLNLTSNLFQGGALRARSRAAEHALYSANAARDRALLELSRFYREARDRSRSLTSSLTLQDQRHASIVKTQELYRHQYLSLGTRTLLDILNTEQEIFQTQVDKQNTLFDLRSLQIDCLYSVGGLRDTFRAGDALNRRVLSRRAEVGS